MLSVAFKRLEHADVEARRIKESRELTKGTLMLADRATVIDALDNIVRGLVQEANVANVSLFATCEYFAFAIPGTCNVEPLSLTWDRTRAEIQCDNGFAAFAVRGSIRDSCEDLADDLLARGQIWQLVDTISPYAFTYQRAEH